MMKINKQVLLIQGTAVVLTLLVTLFVSISSVLADEFPENFDMKVERIRDFECDMSSIGKQADIGSVENGESGESIFIRPVDQVCNFHLFHRSASGEETQLSESPGGYQIVHASVLNNEGIRVICASNVEHTAMKGGKPDERQAQTVPVQCWSGNAGNFGPGVAVVDRNPEYAAWVSGIETHPEKASTYRVIWIRDFSFQFLNMSDAGRPATDGTYETSFTLEGNNLVPGATSKLADTTMYGSETTIEVWEPTPEEMEKFLSQ